jgi:hypothetical protein
MIIIGNNFLAVSEIFCCPFQLEFRKASHYKFLPLQSDKHVYQIQALLLVALSNYFCFSYYDYGY